MRGKSADYCNPYGDLQEPWPKKSASVYHDEGERMGNEESRGLIKGRERGGADRESDLAMAVEDILSCCDGRMNSNEAKLLRNMEMSFQENGNLISVYEREQERFKDEESKAGKFSLRKWFLWPESGKETYVPRSSQFIFELPVREVTSPKKAKAWNYAYAVASVGAILTIGGVLLISLLTDKASTSNLSDSPSPFSSDCSIVGKQGNPSPLSQCVCGGSINSISDQAKEKYDTLLYAFGAEYLHQNETMSSCSARNQALVWLAEDKGSTLDEVLIQRHSLVLFFLKLQGVFWTLKGHQQWLTSGHECTWFGIICNEEKEVTGIELWNLNLVGSIPKEILSLTNLERLSLPENKIAGHLPVDAFVLMTKLTDLTLFMNSISGAIDSRIFGSFTQIKTLNLDSNALTGPIPTEVGKLTGMEQLKLARNDLKGTLPTELGYLTLLKKIELEENNLYGTIPSQMGKLRQLESLDLSWNNLQGSLPREFQAFQNLKDLFLKSNDFRGTLPEIDKAMGKLENLVLSLNAFSGHLPAEMNLMSSLTTVHLDHNNFDGTLPAELGSCSYLRDLKLNNNHFNGPIPTEIGRLAWLISLTLEGNSFNGTMPSEICNLRIDVGTLDRLTATCAAESETEREKAVFEGPHEVICRVPDCCTSCSPKR